MTLCGKDNSNTSQILQTVRDIPVFATVFISAVIDDGVNG